MLEKSFLTKSVLTNNKFSSKKTCNVRNFQNESACLGYSFVLDSDQWCIFRENARKISMYRVIAQLFVIGHSGTFKVRI